MKKLLLLLALSLPLHADEPTLKVGIEGTYPPFSTVDSQGELQGFDVDMARALCAEIKARCELVQTEWDAMIPSLNSKKLDLLVASMSATPERQKQVAFTNKYYANPGRFVLAKAEAEALPADADWASRLKDKTIGVQRGTVHDKYLSAKGESVFKEIVRYNNQEEAYLDLLSGRIDATLADQSATGDFLKANPGYGVSGLSFNDPAYYGNGVAIALRLEDTALRDQLNAAIAALRASGQYQKISEKYFGADIYGD